MIDQCLYFLHATNSEVCFKLLLQKQSKDRTMYAIATYTSSSVFFLYFLVCLPSLSLSPYKSII